MVQEGQNNPWNQKSLFFASSIDKLLVEFNMEISYHYFVLGVRLYITIE